MIKTIADIVAWLRRPRDGENAYLTLWREEIADRIEATENQSVTNCNRFGNAAKIRAALANIVLTTIKAGKSISCDVACGIISSTAKAALAAQPRNCDRPECATTKEAQEVWRKEDGGKTAYYEWLLSTSTKGCAK